MDDSLLTWVISVAIILAAVVPYLLRVRSKGRRARRRFEELQIAGLHEATSMHPHIDVTNCIGCGACVKVCPEGDVLGIIDGKATLIHGIRCVGHGLCAEACPVGAIELLMARPSRSAELPLLTDALETSVKGVFIIGELGGLGLIRNAIEQGKRSIATIASRPGMTTKGYDVVIVGAGPAGLAAGLSAKHHGLSSVIVEQNDIGGAILHYPRAKVVLTSAVELPLWGRLQLKDVSKEELLDLWKRIIKKTELDVHINARVTNIQGTEGDFTVSTDQETFRAGRIVLALGRRGTPKKLEVPGEDLSKVMYRLIDTATYQRSHILVVGGGDSAVEAAVGLAIQDGNTVTLSYRRQTFTRIKERNRQHLEEFTKKRRLKAITESEVMEISNDSVLLHSRDGNAEIRNDFVFVFAGGELPYELLRRAGIAMQTQVLP